MQLITTKGNLITHVAIQPRGQGKFTADLNPHSSVRSFKLKLKGTTQKGYPFERISQKIGSTTTAVAWVKYASNDQTLPLDRTTFIHFQVCNFGATEFFDCLVSKDKLDYLLRRRLSPIRAYKDRCRTIIVSARATRSEDVGKTDAVVIILKGRTSGTVLSETVHLLVDD